MASPYPSTGAFIAHAGNGGGLRIVKKYEIVIVCERFGVQLTPCQVGWDVSGGQISRPSLQAVVNCLRDLKEALVAGNRPPFRDKTKIVQDGNGGPQQFRNSTAIRCRIDVCYPCAL